MEIWIFFAHSKLLEQHLYGPIIRHISTKSGENVLKNIQLSKHKILKRVKSFHWMTCCRNWVNLWWLLRLIEHGNSNTLPFQRNIIVPDNFNRMRDYHIFSYLTQNHPINHKIIIKKKKKKIQWHYSTIQ